MSVTKVYHHFDFEAMMLDVSSVGTDTTDTTIGSVQMFNNSSLQLQVSPSFSVSCGLDCLLSSKGYHA